MNENIADGACQYPPNLYVISKVYGKKWSGVYEDKIVNPVVFYLYALLFWKYDKFGRRLKVKDKYVYQYT